MPLDLDTSDMDPATKAAVQTFATMVGTMPDEALQFLIELLTQELESRG